MRVDIFQLIEMHVFKLCIINIYAILYAAIFKIYSVTFGLFSLYIQIQIQNLIEKESFSKIHKQY